MCGIAGLVYRDPSRPCLDETVTAMRDVMSYRGPDDAGNYLDGPVGLGHRRLSIIDLGGGHQPMSDARGANWIIFNGEIYNYRQSREELIGKGYTFRTHSDTEVILQLYADRGERCVEALNGMFAFAIWDAGRRSLFLARDRMGVKPLYYAETPEAFVFASEIKSLFESGQLTPRAREEALGEYLLFRQVAGSETLFAGVRSLPPGCTMTVRDGRTVISRYWSPRPAAEPLRLAPAAALEQFSALFEDSVKLRLISDVPVGTFCSGGVDSSLVTAVAAGLKHDAVNTFSIGFSESDYDESRYALVVSEQYKTIHHQLAIGNVEFAELFPRMVWHNDEPLDFANSVHIYGLSKLAKQFVTVVLTGEGSDELFGGYPRYRIPGLAQYARMVPGPLRRLAASVTGDARLTKLDRFAALGAEEALLYNSSYLRPEVARELAPALEANLAFRRDCLGSGRRARARRRRPCLAARRRDVPGRHPASPGQDEHGGQHRIARAVHGLPHRRVRQPPANGAQGGQGLEQGDREGVRAHEAAGRDRRSPEIGVRRAAGGLVPRQRRPRRVRPASAGEPGGHGVRSRGAAADGGGPPLRCPRPLGAVVDGAERGDLA